jgi:hypothetical protein
MLTFVGLLVAAASLYFAGRQVQAARHELEESMRAQRAQHFLAIYELYFGDEKTRRFFYQLDWGTWRFDETRIANAEEEPWLDSLLYNLDVIGRMVRIGALHVDDAQLIAFQAARVLNNSEVKRYLEWLERDYREHDLPAPHQDARFLATQLTRPGERYPKE